MSQINSESNSELASETEEKEPRNRPPDGAFFQQRLPAWQPILTPLSVISSHFIVGIICLIIGSVLMDASLNVFEKEIDYTECINDQNKTCSKAIWKNSSKPCFCAVEFEISENVEGPVYFYYSLKNYYQVYRLYIQSDTHRQFLNGSLTNKSNWCCEPNTDCVLVSWEAFLRHTDIHEIKYAPCGNIANSLFNDSFTLLYGNATVPWTHHNTTWPSDRGIWHANPNQSYNQYPNQSVLKKWFTEEGFRKPFDWQKNVWELDKNDDTNNGFLNTDLINWMRPAASPNFRKLYRKHSGEMLMKGNYKLKIEYNYPWYNDFGKKTFIISTTSWAGSKNLFLPICYIIVGCSSIFAAFFFIIFHNKYGKGLTELSSFRDKNVSVRFKTDKQVIQLRKDQ